MSDFRDAVRSGLIEYMEGLEKALDGLSEDELRYQPALHANFIEWIVWHMATGRGPVGESSVAAG